MFKKKKKKCSLQWFWSLSHRLFCLLFLYRCIDKWFEKNRSCPEHPMDWRHCGHGMGHVTCLGGLPWDDGVHVLVHVCVRPILVIVSGGILCGTSFLIKDLPAVQFLRQWFITFAGKGMSVLAFFFVKLGLLVGLFIKLRWVHLTCNWLFHH